MSKPAQREHTITNSLRNAAPLECLRPIIDGRHHNSVSETDNMSAKLTKLPTTFAALLSGFSLSRPPAFFIAT
jgi:hypothetical protein